MREGPKAEAPVLFMEDVSFSYAGGHSGTGVEGISLSLGRGEVALLCGPSGCGKTTVTRLANGLAPHFYEGAETGTVRVCGLDIAHAELWETARVVGSVFQNPKTQFYSVDVRGEVAFGCENLGFKPADIERQVDAAAREFDLAPLIDESLFSLSSGQKQRVACASAAATSPALVVLDEPSSNLDFEAIAQLRSAIARWKAEGIATLVAEHRIHYLEGIADHVLYLDNGRIARRWTAGEFARLDDCRAHAARAARARHRRHLPKQRPLRRSGKARHAKGSTRKRYGTLREPDGALPEERSPREDPRNLQPRASRRERHGVGRLMRRRQIDVRRSRMRPQPMRWNRDFERSPFGKARS